MKVLSASKSADVIKIINIINHHNEPHIILLNVAKLQLLRFSLKKLKGTSGRKKCLAQMKEREKCKKRAITDLNAANGSRDIPFQSHEFEQYGCRHFVDF